VTLDDDVRLDFREGELMAVLLTAPQLAKLMQVNEKEIYRKAQCGMIPSYRFGRARRFDLCEVLAALKDPGPMRVPVALLKVRARNFGTR
jgi:excisionase family DNA binding protein